MFGEKMVGDKENEMSNSDEITCESKEAAEPPANTNLCHLCLRKFATKRSLARHKQDIHKVMPEERKMKNFQCSECSQCFTTSMHIFKHYKDSHDGDITIKEENLTFHSRRQFEDWKESIEKETISCFVTLPGYYKRRSNSSSSLIEYFHCNRTGKYIPKGRGLRNLKAGGTIKMGKFCPARMTVTTTEVNNSLVIKVHFISTHLGHINEPQCTWISRYKKSINKQPDNDPSKLLVGIDDDDDDDDVHQMTMMMEDSPDAISKEEIKVSNTCLDDELKGEISSRLMSLDAETKKVSTYSELNVLNDMLKTVQSHLDEVLHKQSIVVLPSCSEQIQPKKKVVSLRLFSIKKKPKTKPVEVVSGAEIEATVNTLLDMNASHV